MTEHGLRLLQEICLTISVHDESNHSRNVSSHRRNSDPNNISATSSSGLPPRRQHQSQQQRQQQQQQQQPEFNMVASRPVTLREMIFSDGKRIVKPLGREDQLKSKKGGAVANRSSSSSSSSWAVKPEATRADLLEELARRVADKEDVTSVVVALKKLPPPRRKV